MTTSPADPASAAPEPHWGVRPDAPISDIADHRNGNGAFEEADAPGSRVQWVNSELHTIASTIEDLQGRLEQANTRLNSVTKVETTELEIGRLFVEAQRFSEESLAKLEAKVHEILREAETKAKQILAEATEEAQEIRGQAQHAAFVSTTTLRELQSAIVGFTTVNAELLRELGTLNGMLIPGDERGMIGIDPRASTSTSD